MLREKVGSEDNSSKVKDRGRGTRRRGISRCWQMGYWKSLVFEWWIRVTNRRTWTFLLTLIALSSEKTLRCGPVKVSNCLSGGAVVVANFIFSIFALM